MLEEHGLENGIMDLVSLSEKVGEEFGLKVSATCDAKYLEVGISCKSDNVDTILESFKDEGIEAEDCSFWGDEFVGIQEGLYEVTALCLHQRQKQEISSMFLH